MAWIIGRWAEGSAQEPAGPRRCFVKLSFLLSALIALKTSLRDAEAEMVGDKFLFSFPALTVTFSRQNQSQLNPCHYKDLYHFIWQCSPNLKHLPFFWINTQLLLTSHVLSSHSSLYLLSLYKIIFLSIQVTLFCDLLYNRMQLILGSSWLLKKQLCWDVSRIPCSSFISSVWLSGF